MLILEILNVFLTIQEEKKNQKATAIGIPVYTWRFGAIPIVQGLLNSGMSHGAGLAFLIAGPVPTIPAMTAAFALVRRQTFTIYIGSGIVGSLITGYIYQIIIG